MEKPIPQQTDLFTNPSIDEAMKVIILSIYKKAYKYSIEPVTLAKAAYEAILKEELNVFPITPKIN